MRFMNIGKIREDFPILSEGIIYMDSAATSLTAEPMLNAILDYYRNYRANIERGVHSLSQIASQRYEEAHRKVAAFIKEHLLAEVEPLSLGGGTIEEVSLEDYELAKGYRRFEAGTPNIAGGIGLGKAVDYLREIGMEEIRKYEEKLTMKMIEGLLEMKNVDLYGPEDAGRRIGTVSFNVKGLNPHDVALMLDEASNIKVRSGHHCCMPLMKYLGLDGTVRASLYLYNTKEEVEMFLRTVEDIARI